MNIELKIDNILNVFETDHKIASVIDPEVDPYIQVSSKLLLSEWKNAMDLISNPEIQWHHFNKKYSLEVSKEKFYKIWIAKNTTLGELAEFIVENAKQIYIPDWKFAGKEFKTCSILRFLISELKKDSKIKVSGYTSFNKFLKNKNWNFVSNINLLFPGVLPNVTFIDQKSILPESVKISNNIFRILLFVCILLVLLGIFFKKITLVLFLFTFVFLITILKQIFNIIINLPNTSHYIFKGIGSIRCLAIKINTKLEKDFD